MPSATRPKLAILFLILFLIIILILILTLNLSLSRSPFLSQRPSLIQGQYNV